VEHPERAQTESIIDLLRADDAQVAGLFDRFASAEQNRGPQAARDRLIGRICQTLSIQRLAEEEVLYPALRVADDKLVFAFLLAGLGLSMRIAEIRDPGKARAIRDTSFSRLAAMVRSNLSERARVLLPFARSRLSPTQLRWLGDGYVQRKARLWTVSNAAHAPRAVAPADRMVRVIPMALWRKRRGPDNAHPAP
jgi:hypothetical protein